MDKLWTLHVENFGKIAEADVSISPLMWKKLSYESAMGSINIRQGYFSENAIRGKNI